MAGNRIEEWKAGEIAPGAHIELRDAVWRVERVDLTSSGTQAWLGRSRRGERVL